VQNLDDYDDPMGWVDDTPDKPVPPAIDTHPDPPSDAPPEDTPESGKLKRGATQDRKKLAATMKRDRNVEVSPSAGSKGKDKYAAEAKGTIETSGATVAAAALLGAKVAQAVAES